MARRLLALIALAFVVCLEPSLSAQGSFDPVLEEGIQPFQPYSSGNVDSINLATGALSIRIPVVSFPQRGAMHLDYALSYSFSGTSMTGPRFSVGTEWYAGPSSVGLVNNGFPTVQSSVSTCTSYNGCEDFIAVLYDADGNHPLGFTNSTATQARSVDGSGYFVTSPLQLSNYTITDRHGVITSHPNGAVITSIDTNGNQMSTPFPGFGAVTDTTGKVIPAPGSLSGNGTYNWNVPASDGSTAAYKGTNSGAILPNGTSTNFEFFLPDNTSYSFVFQSVTLPLVGDEGPDSQQSLGVVNKITLPTGGTSLTPMRRRQCSAFAQECMHRRRFFHVPSMLMMERGLTHGHILILGPPLR